MGARAARAGGSSTARAASTSARSAPRDSVVVPCPIASTAFCRPNTAARARNSVAPTSFHRPGPGRIRSTTACRRDSADSGASGNAHRPPPHPPAGHVPSKFCCRHYVASTTMSAAAAGAAAGAATGRSRHQPTLNTRYRRPAPRRPDTAPRSAPAPRAAAAQRGRPMRPPAPPRRPERHARSSGPQPRSRARPADRSR